MITIKRQKITITNIRRPPKQDPNKELQWLGNSLGLFSLRDKDKSCFRIFIQLLKNTKGRGLTSDDIAEKLTLSRGTVIHHMHKLIDSGLVISAKNKYSLRVENLQTLVDELKKDTERTYSDIKDVAKEIDRKLRLNE